MKPANSITGEAVERRVLMQSDRRFGDARLIPEFLKRGDAAHVGGKRQERDRKEHFQPHAASTARHAG